MAKQRTDTESVMKLVINGEQAKTSLKELTDTARKYRTEFLKMREADDPKAYKERREELKRLNTVLKETNDQLRSGTKNSKSFTANMKEIAAGVVGGNVLMRAWDLAAQGVTNFITKNAELSDVMAGVQKTTGLTENSVDRLNEKFKRFNTRTTNTELLGLAQVAGKLGISAERDVEGFVRAADRIGVALGEDLGGVEESVNSLGKLVDIFRLKDEYGIEDALMRVGSAINSLGASGTAAEKNLVDFAQRMAGIAPAANISLQDILGLAATADELGQSMESSATAIGQFIVGLGKDIPKNARIAGMSVADFSKLLKEDANEAFIRVLENSKAADGGLEALARNMGVLEISGARGIAALGALAERTDLLRLRQQQGNRAFQENISIMGEFNNMNTTLGANIEKIWNRIGTIWENSELRAFFTDVTGAIADNRSALEKATAEYDKARSTMSAMETDLIPLLDRYDELTKKGDLTESEHRELSSIIATLSEQYPIAISQMDEYGNAMSINTDIVRGNVEEHRRYLRIINEKAIAEANEQKAAKQRHKERLEMEIREKRETKFLGGAGTGGGGGQVVTMDLTNEQLKEKRRQLTELNDEIFAIDYTLKNLGVDSGNAVIKALDVDEKDLDTIEKIKKRIAELTELRNKAVIGSEEYKRVEAEIQKLYERMSPSKPNTPGGGAPDVNKDAEEKRRKQAEKEREDAERDYKKLIEAFDVLDAQRLRDQLSKNQQEIADEKAKYNKLIKEYEDFKNQKGATAEQIAEADAKIAELETTREEAINAMRVRQQEEYLAKIENLRAGLAIKHASELDKEKARINAFYDALEKENEGNETAMAELRLARQKELNEAEKREFERLIKDKERLEAEYNRNGMSTYDKRLAEINLKYDAEVAALKEKYSQQIIATEEYQAALKAIEEGRSYEITQLDEETWNNRLGLALKAAEIIADTVFQITSNNARAESDMRLDQLRKQREKELSERNLTEAQKQAINKKYDQMERSEKRKAWQAQKRADIAQSLINTALSVGKTFAQFGWPAGIIPAAFAAGAGLAQTTIIAAQKPPQFAKGGILPAGSSHAQGGIDLMDRRRGKIVGNIEGGEPILSRDTYRNNRAIVDELLYSSQRKAGAAVRLNPDLIDADRAVRNGGRAMHSRGKAPVVNVAPPVVDVSEITEAVKQLVDAQWQANSRPVMLSTRLLEDWNERKVRITNDVDA